MTAVIETNPLTATQKAAQATATRYVDWTEPGLTITRLRLLSDPGFPVWDVSYCYGEMPDGEVVRVQLPFVQLPKRGMLTALFTHAKRSGHFIKGLSKAVSTLN